MPVACPKCGSRFLRDSHPRNAQERLQKWWFKSPLRCIDCKTRFIACTLILSDVRYARCPRCYRMDLNGWTGKTYHPPFWMGLKATVGARRYRCEYCRFNFVSFRIRKEAFTFGRWAKTNAGAVRAAGRSRMTELQDQVRGVSLVADLSRQQTNSPQVYEQEGERGQEERPKFTE